MCANCVELLRKLREGAEPTEGQDRGEFGMPGLGALVAGLMSTGARVELVPVSPEIMEAFLADRESEEGDGEQPTEGKGRPEKSKVSRVANIFDEAQTLYARKALDYGAEDEEDVADNLGAMGQFADMNRKFGKLRRILWQGHEPVGESVEEILMDFMGHCALTIDYIRQEGR